jgi:hypothetical protein
MATNLSVRISKASMGKYYYLKADLVEHSIVRMPTQAPLPTDQGSSSPNVFGMDLGMCVEQVTVSGLIDEVADLTNNFPSKYDLENVARKWATQDLTNDVGSAIILIVGYGTNGAEQFNCAVKSLTFRKEGGLEDRWAYSLVMLHYPGSNNS